MRCDVCGQCQCTCNAKPFTFWMVYVDGTVQGSVRHATAALARTEAQRLAGTMPGRKVFVLKATLQIVSGGMTETQLNPAPEF